MPPRQQAPAQANTPWDVQRPPITLANGRQQPVPILPIKYEDGPLGGLINTTTPWEYPVDIYYLTTSTWYRWPSSEAYFQAEKVALFMLRFQQTPQHENLKALYEKLAHAVEPYGQRINPQDLNKEIIKIIGQAAFDQIARDQNHGWAAYSSQTMQTALMSKLNTQSPKNMQLKDQLIQLGQENARRAGNGEPPILIVEISAHDSRWASGPDGTGENALGAHLNAVALMLYYQNTGQQPPDYNQLVQHYKQAYEAVKAAQPKQQKTDRQGHLVFDRARKPVLVIPALSHNQLLRQGNLGSYQENDLRKRHSEAMAALQQILPGFQKAYYDQTHGMIVEFSSQNAAMQALVAIGNPQDVQALQMRNGSSYKIALSQDQYDALTTAELTRYQQQHPNQPLPFNPKLFGFDEFKKYAALLRPMQGNQAQPPSHTARDRAAQSSSVAQQRGAGVVPGVVHRTQPIQPTASSTQQTTPTSLQNQIDALTSEIPKFPDDSKQKKLKELKVAFLKEVQTNLSNNPDRTFTEAIRQAISNPSSNSSHSWNTDSEKANEIISGVISTRTQDVLVDLVKKDLLKVFERWGIDLKKAGQLADKIARKTFDHMWEKQISKTGNKDKSSSSPSLNHGMLNTQRTALENELSKKEDQVKMAKFSFLEHIKADIEAKPPFGAITAIKRAIQNSSSTGEVNQVIAGRFSHRTRDVLIDLVEQDLKLQLMKADVPPKIASKIASGLAETQFHTIWSEAIKQKNMQTQATQQETYQQINQPNLVRKPGHS